MYYCFLLILGISLHFFKFENNLVELKKKKVAYLPSCLKPQHASPETVQQWL